MALAGYILVVASFGVTLRLLQRCPTLFDSGAEGRNERYFCDMKGSCTYRALLCLGCALTAASFKWCAWRMDQEHRGRP
jgi:hypothetical protein